MDQHYFKLILLIYARAESRDKGGVGVFKTNHFEQMTAIQVTIPHEKRKNEKNGRQFISEAHSY